MSKSEYYDDVILENRRNLIVVMRALGNRSPKESKGSIFRMLLCVWENEKKVLEVAVVK